MMRGKVHSPQSTVHRILLSIFFGFCSLFSICYAQSISSSELINNAKRYDGQTVIYGGEVIGEIMARGKYAWINLNDANNALGIWIQKDLIAEVFYSGSYKFRGDSVEVSGVFHRACPEHGGDLDIHARSIRKISSGEPLRERLNISKRNFTFILLGILCLISILSFLKPK